MEKLTSKFVLALLGGDFFHLYMCKLTLLCQTFYILGQQED